MQYLFILMIISIYSGYLPSSPTTAQFETFFPTPSTYLLNCVLNLSILLFWKTLRMTLFLELVILDITSCYIASSLKQQSASRAGLEPIEPHAGVIYSWLFKYTQHTACFTKNKWLFTSLWHIIIIIPSQPVFSYWP